MFQIGDIVKVGRQIGKAQLVDMAGAWTGKVVDIIPAYRVGNDVYRDTMYRIRGEEITAPTLTPTPNEQWVDAVCVFQ